MSDIFKAIRGQALFPAAENPAAKLFSEIQERATQYSQEQQQRREELGSLVVNEWEYSIISEAIATAQDPEEERFRWAAAIEYSRQFEKPVFEVYTNLEAFNKFWLGKSAAPRSNWLAVKDSFEMGRLSMEMGRLGGRWLDSGGTDAELERQLDELSSEMEALADHLPRPWYIQALKWGAQTAPFTLGPMLSYAGAGTLVGGPAGTVLGMVMAGVQSFEIMRGLEYYKLRKAGVTHGIASPLAHISGGIQAAIEMALGNIPALASKLGSGAIQTITGNVMKRLAVSGKLGAIGRGVMGYVGQAFEEGVEEAAQELVSAGTLALAAELQGQGVDKPTADQVAREVWESAKGGFVASLTMGIPGSVIGFRGDAAQSRVLTELAGQLGKEDFVKQAKGAGLAMFEGMSEEQQSEALSRIWESQNQRQKKTQEKVRAAEEKTAQAEEAKEKITGEIRRLAGGRLYTSQKSVTDTEAGEVRAILKAGDPLTGQRYGYIDYTVEGDQVTINRVAVRGGIGREIRKEMVLDLMERHPGVNVEWNTTVPGDLEIKRELIARNPRGEAAGLQWYGAEEEIPGVLNRESLRKKLEQYRQRLGLTEDRQVDVALDWIDRNARYWGISTDEYLQGAYVPEMIGEGEPEGGLASQRGATAFRSIGDTVKAILYFGQNADFSTWLHETSHGFLNFGLQNRSRSQNIETRMREIEKAFGVKEENWEAIAPEKWQAWYREQAGETGASLSNVEFFAYALEDYLRTGVAPTPQTKTILQKIAEWLYGIYKTLKNRVELSDDIVAFFDRYMEETSSPLAELARTEEQVLHQEEVDESQIVNPVDPALSQEKKVQRLVELSKANKPIIDTALRKVDQELGTQSKSSFKKPENILSKANRPEIKTRKPWFDVEHVRDSLRFKTVLNTLEDFPKALEIVFRETGAQVVKLDTEKMLEPKDWGWRFAAADLRMPNGQLVEYYAPLKELEAAKKSGNHALFEKWRNKNQKKRDAKLSEYQKDLDESFRRYQEAWEEALARLGLDESAAAASWNSVSARLESVTRLKLSLRSSALGAPVERQTPFDLKPKSPRSEASTITRPVDRSSETTIGESSTTSIGRSEEEIKKDFLFQAAQILFQGPTEALREMAADFDSWKEFRDYVEAMFPEEELGGIGRLSEEEKDAWYRRTWQQARQMQPQTPATEARAADEAFLESIRTDQGLKRFLRDLWEDAISTARERQAAEYGVETEEELAELEERREKATRVAREAHPLIHASAIAAGMNRPVKPSTLKAIRTMIGKAPREYRTLHAVVTGDVEALAQLERDLQARPEIKDPRWVKALAEGSIVERQRMARQIKNEEFARKIRSGEVELTKDVQEYLAELREKQTDVQATIREQEKELQEDRKYLSRYERKIVDLRTELKTYERELDLVNKRISRFLERKAAIPEELLGQRSRIQREIQTIKRSVARARRQAGGNTAKAIAYLNRIEAVAKLRDQYRSRERERRAAKKIRERMLQLGKRITQAPSASIHVDYADRIRELQKAIDPKFRSAKTLRRLEASRKYYETQEGRQRMPAEVLERILKKPLNQWTLAELEELNERVENLRRLGRLRYHLEKAHKRRFRQAESVQAQRTLLGMKPPRKAVGRAKRTPWWTKVQLGTLKPDRIAQLLDGGKKGGVFYRWLVERPNAAWNATVRSIDNRVKRMREKMDELGFTVDPFDTRIKTKGFEWVGRPVDVDGFRYDDGSAPSLQDAMYWLIGMRNEKTAKALLQGNALPSEVIRKGIDLLTPKEMALANFIQDEFDDNFDRVREVARANYNFDPEPEEFYVPMRRRDLSGKIRGDELAIDYAGRHGWIEQGIQKGFIKERYEISDIYQMPIRTDLISLWYDAVQQEERFIHQDELVHDMRAVLEEVQTRRALQERFGPDVNRWISKYINDLARDDIYAAKTGAEKAARVIRSNLVVSYLSFNLLTSAKQGASIAAFLTDSSPGHLASAAGQWLAAKARALAKGQIIGNELVAFVEERSELIKHRSINREFEELKRLDGGLYNQIVKKVGTVGMMGIQWVDKATVTIGWKAVYDHQLAKGATEADAIKAADEAVARSQPSGRVQDLAEIYRSSGMMKWFTMFTNALNAYWNIIAFDIPMAVKNGEILLAMGNFTAVAISGAMIALVSGALAGGDDEEKRKKMIVGIFSQYTSTIPLAGSYITRILQKTAGLRTYGGSGIDIFPAAEKAGQAVRYASREEYQKALAAAIEGMGYTLGLPVSGPRRVMKVFEQRYLGAILGWKKGE